MMYRLDLGSGSRTDPGWLHIDRVIPDPADATVGAVFMEHDLTDLPLPIPENSATMAVAHHVLDAFAEPDLHALCAEVYRLLEPGGVWRISSPDYEHAVRALVRYDYEWFTDLGVPAEQTIAQTFQWYLFWGGARKTPLLSPEHLGYEFLEPAGFTWTRCDFYDTTTRNGTICELDSRERESFFCEATKPRG